MSGKFLFRNGFILGIIYFIGGIYVAKEMGVSGIQAIQNGENTANISLYFSICLLTFLFAWLSIISLSFNNGAYLKITDEKLEAKFGWNQTLSLKISEISGFSTTEIDLIIKDVNNKQYIISFLLNARKINRYLKQLTGVDKTENINIKKAEKKLKSESRKFRLYALFTLLFFVMIFVNIAIIVILSGNEDIAYFNMTYLVIFIIFVFTEFLTFYFSIFFRQKAAKHNKINSEILYIIKIYYAKKYKNITPIKYSEAIEIHYFAEYTNRMVILKNNKSIYSFITEEFSLKTKTWKTSLILKFIYKSRKYKSLEELKKAAVVIFEDEYFED